MTRLLVVPARAADLGRYIDLLEDTAQWLEARDITQWPSGSFRGSAAYYAESIRRGEVYLALVGEQFIGTLRILLREPIVWPEIVTDDAIYVYNLAVRRTWGGNGLGRQLLDWAENRAASLGRRFIRLDCVADNHVLSRYYVQAGFEERGEIEASFPEPVGTLCLRRYEKPVG